MGAVSHDFFWNPTGEEIDRGVAYVATTYEGRIIERDRLMSVMERLLRLFHFDRHLYVDALRLALAEHGLGDHSIEREVFKSAIHAAFEDRRERGRHRHAHPGHKAKPAEPDPIPEDRLLPAAGEELPLLALIALDIANLRRHECAESRALFQLPDDCDPI
jgi:hypothetical protein